MMTGILNLTQHSATAEQKDRGVYDLFPEDRNYLTGILTFEEPPTPEKIRTRAVELAQLASSEGVKSAMIGGAPFLMSALEHELLVRGITPLYAFSKREVVETTEEDGSVTKKAIFRFEDFVTAP